MSESPDPSAAVDQGKKSLAFTLNGVPRTLDVRPDCSLLSVLRDDFDLISPKNGCEPMGQCGCCTVLIDDKPRLSCTLKAASVNGKSVATLEGLPEETRRQIGDCFVHAGGVQCGFCIPGIAMRAHALCERSSHPSRAEIAHDLRAHLCRCTGYTKIVDAIDLLARVRRGEAMPENRCVGKVGEPLDRFSGHEATLGSRPFIDDIKVPGMVFGAPRLADHPRALVRAIDPAPALALPGVLWVVTAVDVPGQRFGGLISPDWPIFIAVGEETRYVGDVLAFVVAADLHTARRAAELIEIDYEIRTPITTPDEALQPYAPRIHPSGNLLARCGLVRGEPETALAGSKHVIEQTWQTQCIEHMFLEPEACLASPHEGGLRVLSQGQGIFDDRRRIAQILGWPEARVYVELVSCGGAFGGKEDLSIQGQTALAAALVGRPVKCVLTRAQSMRLHPKRHPVRITLKVGCDADGRLTAVRARIVGDKGAYASVGAKVLERAAGHAIGPYRCENIDIESLAVYTNNPPNGAMRGFGANQAAYAIEGALDLLAERVGIDGWEIRSLNILEPGDRFCTGQRLTKAFGLRQTLDAVKDVYRGAKFAGIACGIKNVGIGNGLPEFGRASLTVEADGRITIRTGHTEMGQGLFTVVIQAAVEETGIPAHYFTARCDTADPNDSGQTTGSRGTVMQCHAVIDACKKLNADLAARGAASVAGRRPDIEDALKQLAGRKYLGEWQCYPTDKFGAHVAEPRTHLTYGFATQVCILDDTGRVQKFVAAHDVGRVMNPVLLEGQIEGSIHMGLGYALTEQMVYDQGRLVTDDVKSCGILRAHHMPEIELILVEEPDLDCAYGARGVGEIGLVPTAPAVAGALAKFEKFRRFRLPMNDSPAAQAILGNKRP